MPVSASEEAGFFHILCRDQRTLGQYFFADADAQGTDLITGFDRRFRIVRRDDISLQFINAATWQSQVQIIRQRQGNAVGFARSSGCRRGWFLRTPVRWYQTLLYPPVCLTVGRALQYGALSPIFS